MSSFDDILEEVRALHKKKSTDYGRVVDPYANVRASEDFGIPGWVGAVVRQNDKMRRLQKFAQDGYLANESVEDSLIDNIVYGIIALALFREENNATQEGQVEQSSQPEHSHGDEGGQATEAGSGNCPICRWTKPGSETQVNVTCAACGLSLEPQVMVNSRWLAEVRFVHVLKGTHNHTAVPNFMYI
jgi:hypothetical protein